MEDSNDTKSPGGRDAQHSFAGATAEQERYFEGGGDEQSRTEPRKPASPPISETTKSSSTPTSIGNVSAAGGGEGKGPPPEFPKSITPPVVPEEGSWPYGPPEKYSCAIKLLVTNNVAGSIIGRAGQTISELQSQSSTRIKLSQAGDYYPGTQDRVCLIQGDPGPVKVALQLLMERLYMLQEHTVSSPMSPGFDFVVRLLVPTSSCGMIIGKSGSNIKFMEETTGVSSIRLSPKDEAAATTERIVTVIGANVACCLQCVYAILDGMTSHPEISRYTNMTTSYSACMAAAAAAAASVSSPYSARHHGLLQLPTPTRHSPPEHLWNPVTGQQQQHHQAGLTRRIASSPDLPGVMLSQRLTPQRMHQDRVAGYSNSGLQYSPIPMPGVPGSQQQQPLYLMPRPNPVGPPFLEFNRDGKADSSPHQQQQQQLHHLQSSHQSQHPVSHSASAPDLLAVQIEQSLHLTPPLPSPLQHAPPPPPPPPQQPLQQEYTGNSALVPQTPTMIAPGCFNAQVLIPDSMIGSILGRGGRTLNELQMLSGTRIRISQRGEFMPGTRSRIVTIRGTTAQAVWQAQYMMSQRMVLPPTAAYNVTRTAPPSHEQPGPDSTRDSTSTP